MLVMYHNRTHHKTRPAGMPYDQEMVDVLQEVRDMHATRGPKFDFHRLTPAQLDDPRVQQLLREEIEKREDAF